MKLTKQQLKIILKEEIEEVIDELNACHDKDTGKLSSCKQGDSYSLSKPAVRAKGHDPDRAGKGKVTSRGKLSPRFGMADGSKACGRKTVSGKKINPKYRCAEYPNKYEEGIKDLIPSVDDSDSDRLDKLGYPKHLQALGRGVIRQDEATGIEYIFLPLSELVQIVYNAFQDKSNVLEGNAEEKKRIQAVCKANGYLTSGQAQERILVALNNFSKAADGKLFEPQGN